jgi:uncharacterized phage protein (TIGR02220 family)
MTKEAYYFSHDANARNDEKVLMLRAEHGMQGYGIYWCLLEMMFESADTKLFHSKEKGMAVSYNIDITVLQSVINTCVTEGLFESDGEKFWSESLMRRKGKYLDYKKKKSEAGKKGMEKRWGKKENDNGVITEPKQNDNGVITENNKGKEIKEKEIKIPYKEIIDLLNEHSNSKFKLNAKATKTAIKARWEEDYAFEDFKLVIEYFCKAWKGKVFSNGKNGDDYLRPSTLFNNRFDERLNEARKKTNSSNQPPKHSNALTEDDFMF